MYGGEDMDKWYVACRYMADGRLDTYRINTASYYFTTFALLPLLAAAGKGGAQPGNVINISSISGVTKTSQRGQFNYNASK
jgi:NAD(P)-dependent dehydrogenase (short-subunit alcohol dehydrogenase family)